MKTTIVPAQITSVEDKVVGNISVKQLLLLMSPVFLGVVIFAFLPPFIKYTTLKLAIVSTIVTVCSVLAIRWRGKLVAEWIAIMSRYNSRPRHYVYSKKDSFLRPKHSSAKRIELEVPIVAEEQPETDFAAKLAPSEFVRLEHAIENPAANFRFSVTRKGGLRVHIKEIR